MFTRRGQAHRRFRRKQRAAKTTGARYYGDGGTIHGSVALDVEVYQGRVVAVWFRCQQLPFVQRDVDEHRAADMDVVGPELSRVMLTGVEVIDT